VSTRRRSPAAVCRNYRPDPDYCVHAIALLLRKLVSKEAAGAGGPDDTKESKNDGAARTNLTR
jgi:hypothetical protein